MSTTQEQLLKAVAAGLSGVPDRYPGYRSGLKGTLAEVLQLERQNLEQKIDIRVKVRDRCDAAGDMLCRQTRNREAISGTEREDQP